MRNLRYIILLLAASLVWSCQMFEEGHIEPTGDDWGNNVEVLANGQIKYTTTLKSVSMASVETRATSDEDAIYNGWCLVFGEDEDNIGKGYTEESPLIQLAPIVANEDGTFSMIFDEYPNVAFMRIVVNLTDREQNNFGNLYANHTNKGEYTTWRKALEDYEDELADCSLANPPTDAQVKEYNIAKYGQYRYQSVGLDGIYNVTYNTTTELKTFDPPYTNLNEDPSYYGVIYHTAESDYTGYSQINVEPKLEESYNKNIPDAKNDVKTTGFPMSSYGFLLPEITPESIKALDEESAKIEMVRVCSKVQVKVDDPTFEVSEIHLIDVAQEARIRNTVFASTTSTDGENGLTQTDDYAVPKDLGGTIAALSLTETVTNGSTSSSIYFYPNKGGAYDYYNGVVNKSVNPQYLIVKGKSSKYDTPGYYKVALKARYKERDGSLSALTYDILRNNSFTVNLNNIDKPGYKTYEVAADPDAPASNISYSLTIESSNNRYEILVSNGTYYTELETSRVYVKGYMADGLEGCYLDFTMHPSQEGNYTPGVYVQASDHDGEYDEEDVKIAHCLVMHKGDAGYDSDDWSGATRVDPIPNNTGDKLGAKLVHIDKSDKSTKVRVYYNVKDSGRIRLRMGDILKFIPVVYDPAPISIYGTKGQDGTGTGIVVKDAYGNSWDDFSYAKSSDITYTYEHVDFEHGGVIDTDFVIEPNGTVTDTNIGVYNDKPELRARISPAEAGDGNAVIYLRQASDFRLANGDIDFDENATYEVKFTAQGSVHANNTHGLFKTVKGNGTTTADKIVFDASDEGYINPESVDDVTISIDTKVIQADKDSDGKYLVFFDEKLDENDQKLSLTVQKMDYKTQAYKSRNDIENEITQENIAESIVTVQNSAGDHKKYKVTQTQYPPIYIVVPSYGEEKEFSMCGDPTNRTTDEVCVYAINIYGKGYDDGVDGCGVNGEWIKTGGRDKDFNYLKSIMYEAALNSKYLTNYGNNKSTNTSQKGYSFDELRNNLYFVKHISENNNEKYEWYTLSELNKQNVDYTADACYVLIRNTDKMQGSLWYRDAYAKIKITVTDMYGETYNTEKDIHGKD